MGCSDVCLCSVLGRTARLLKVDEIMLGQKVADWPGFREGIGR